MDRAADRAGDRLPDGLIALWPFQTVDQVRLWHRAQEATGSDPQHRLDPAATALEFTRGALGFTGVDRVTGLRAAGAGVHVDVGWAEEPGDVLTVATLRLVRLGEQEPAPWVVTGTVDAAAAFSRPAYGETVALPLQVAGRLTGVDETLRVAVLGSGGRVLGTAGPVGLGGPDQPWSVNVPLALAPAAALVTVVAWTGGHVGEVEWFAVTAARLPGDAAASGRAAGAS